MTVKAVIVLAGASLAACSPGGPTANTVDAPPVTSSVNMSAMSGMMMGEKFKGAQTAGQSFVNSAAAADAFEIAISNMALAASQSPTIKAFATDMIAVHQASTAKLKDVMAGMHPPMTPEPGFTPAQRKMIDDLKGKTGAAFDAAFTKAQVSAHEDTLDGMKYFAAKGDDWPELKAFASEMAPTVAEHLKMAKALK